MLAFVTSLRNPLNSADYGRVETLLAQTLASVTAQTSDDFHVFVVGNRRPPFGLGHKVTFVPVDFPPPVATSGPRTAREPFIWDKGTKIGIGLLAARAVSPDHVMIFDADDFVHRDLAAFVGERKDAPGWVIEQGYMFSRARQAYRDQAEFNRVCGTCHIVAWESYEVPADLDTTASQEQVAAGFGERLHEVLGAHLEARTWFARHGVVLEPLPFKGAVYHVDTGENHSGKALAGFARPLDATLTDAFAVPRLGSFTAAAWGALGTEAIRTGAPELWQRGRAKLASYRRRA
jgi:hypothetical protein